MRHSDRSGERLRLGSVRLHLRDLPAPVSPVRKRRQTACRRGDVGPALSFKAQSLFLAPLLLYLFLSGQMRLRHLLAIPCIYLLMMVPAAMAGRPWKELLTVYYVQALDSAELSVFAANPWWFVGHFHLMSPLAGLIAGILLGGATGLAIALASLMLRRGAGTNLLVAAVSAAALPYVLPRMHDRYFFIADLLTLAMAFAWPRYWLAAVLFQAGSLTSYLAYFGLSATGPGYAVVPMTAGLVLLLSAFREQLDGRPAISLAHVINCAFNPLTINENHGDDS